MNNARAAIPLTDQIGEVLRELEQRERTYPRWVAAGTLSQGEADSRLFRLRAVLDSLRRLTVLDA